MSVLILENMPSAQPEQPQLDGTETTVEILSELRSRFNCFDICEEPFYRALSEAIKAVSSQPEQRWNPVTERLPEPSINPNTLDFEKVLCSTAFGDVRVYGYGKPHLSDVAHFWHGCGIMDVYVKAWMPLPEPYQAERRER